MKLKVNNIGLCSPGKVQVVIDVPKCDPVISHVDVPMMTTNNERACMTPDVIKRVTAQVIEQYKHNNPQRFPPGAYTVITGIDLGSARLRFDIKVDVSKFVMNTIKKTIEGIDV